MADWKQKVEALLYLKGQPMTIEAIATILECDQATAEAGLIDLLADYAHRDTALEISETDLGYALHLRPEFMTLVQKVVPTDISKGALRTLAVIALKNPISQADLVELRGSSAYQHIQELVAQGFVKKRRQSEGRSYWLQITDKFHQYFAIGDLQQLQTMP
jgi:segregation and condensation protein B